MEDFINHIKSVLLQYLRFNVVGVINTFPGYALYSLAVFLGGTYELSLIISYAVGIVSAYFLHKKFTFKRAESFYFGSFFKMVGVYPVGFGVNMLILRLMIERNAWNPYLVQIIAIFVVSLVTFILQKIFMFRERIGRKSEISMTKVCPQLKLKSKTEGA